MRRRSCVKQIAMYEVVGRWYRPGRERIEAARERERSPSLHRERPPKLRQTVLVVLEARERERERERERTV